MPSLVEAMARSVKMARPLLHDCAVVSDRLTLPDCTAMVALPLVSTSILPLASRASRTGWVAKGWPEAISPWVADPSAGGVAKAIWVATTSMVWRLVSSAVIALPILPLLVWIAPLAELTRKASLDPVGSSVSIGLRVATIRK